MEAFLARAALAWPAALAWETILVCGDVCACVFSRLRSAVAVLLLGAFFTMVAAAALSELRSLSACPSSLAGQ